ncbi:hypothetical protein GCM10023067_04840 [Aminobacter aganoensis]
MADRLVHGTEVRGEKVWNAVLTSDSVREIRTMRGTMSFAKIGARYGVNRATIGDIMYRKTWRWLE